jgi:uncharacterized protein (TIGR00270 family)
MGQCELCGADGALRQTIIEKVEMKVCAKCGAHGEPVYASQSSNPRSAKGTTNTTYGSTKKWVRPKDNSFEFIVPNAGSLIKAEREKKGLKQIDLSRRLNIKESLIHQIESGHVKPTIPDMKKFEDAFGLKLVVNQKMAEFEEEESAPTQGFTLGDMIKRKMKKL